MREGITKLQDCKIARLIRLKDYKIVEQSEIPIVGVALNVIANPAAAG